MQAFVVVTHFGALVYGPFTEYPDAEAAAMHSGSTSGHPVKIEKYFFCRDQPGPEKFCSECVRVLKERGEKAEAAFKLGSKLGISFKAHA